MRVANTRIISTLFVMLACQVFFANTAAGAVSIGLSNLPLFVKAGVEPNIFLSVDDSRSMGWSYMGTGIVKDKDFNTKRAKSSTWNKLYYDPGKIYTPPVNANGDSLGNATFTAAWDDGFRRIGDAIGDDVCTVDLSKKYRPTWGADGGFNCNGEDKNDDADGNEFSDDPNDKPTDSHSVKAYYYRYDNLTGDGDTENDDNYTKIVVEGAEQEQNFANWYSYYRNRLLITKTTITQAFSKLGTGFRLSFQNIHDQQLSPLAKFGGTERSNFFSLIGSLANKDILPGTPLRTALQNVGETLRNSKDPYRDDPSNPDSTARSCRQNFHIVLTDGEWNRTLRYKDKNNSGPGNADKSTATDIPDNDYNVETYEGRPPYKDNNEDYLADIAFDYWITDLSTLPDNVPTSIKIAEANDPEATFWNHKNDPASWQHLVNFIISFGVQGKLRYPDELPNLIAGTTKWGDNKIDDVWHAAINSRGSFLLAKDSTTLLKTLSDALHEIISVRGETSAAPVTVNSGSITTDTMLYQVKFDTTDWTGKLLALPISNGSSNDYCDAKRKTGDVCSPKWEASCKLDGGSCSETGETETGLDWSDRTIISFNPSTRRGIPFRWSNLYHSDDSNTDQQDRLNVSDNRGSERLDYIRGDKSYELASCDKTNRSDCYFRDRYSLLGDIINSSPVYIGAPQRIYPDSLESVDATHTQFRTDHRERGGMVYVGANDGMLHGFSAADGSEKIAYVPNMVFKNLASFTDKNYSHTNFVDGQLGEGDAFFGDAWHTVLVGGLGYGGQGVFALDVTDPSTFSEDNSNSIVLWEFSDERDATATDTAKADRDLGYTYGKPLIRKLNNGKWAAIFGNGYDNTAEDGYPSSTGNAAIYIVDISDGSLIKKLSTNQGIEDDPTGAGRPNGITGIKPFDANGDFKIDYIYAGDLFGNIWRFDLTSNNKSDWATAFSGKPLFKATDGEHSSGNAQPITTAPDVGYHETLIGAMIYFGTGKYLGTNDAIDTSKQTFYGIWDRWLDNETDFSTLDRDDLQEQRILKDNQNQFPSAHARITTNNSIDWSHKKGWRLDLNEPGERVTQDPLLRDGRIIFVTVTPAADPCVAGSSSWLMELDAASGSRLDTSPFDYNNDGDFTSDDQIEYVVGNSTVTLGGSGIRIGHDDDFTGVYTIPAVLNMPSSGNERKYIGTSAGTVDVVGERGNGGPKYTWHEIMECGI